MKRNTTLFSAAAAGTWWSRSSPPAAVAPPAARRPEGLYGSAGTASAPTGSAGAAKVGAANTSLGRIVVDNTGRTLYLFEKDANGRSACYGPCATYWPPLLTKGNPLAQTGVNQQLVGTASRTDGTNR